MFTIKGICGSPIARRLILLAALWGGSFIFFRIAAPELGPILVAFLRVVIAGGAQAAPRIGFQTTAQLSKSQVIRYADVESENL